MVYAVLLASRRVTFRYCPRRPVAETFPIFFQACSTDAV